MGAEDCKRPPDVGAQPVSSSGGEPVADTRRAFLRGVGKKAAFVAPVIWSLTAQEAQAAASGAVKLPAGASCQYDSDCQSGVCSGGTCAP